MAAKRRRRVLIVDDSAVMRSVLRSVVSSDLRLEVAGTAVDGATALACLPYTRPDLVLLDIEMPVMDGLATLCELRKRNVALPVIMCSSLTRRGARVTVDALAGGAADYVNKPTGPAGREAAMLALAGELIPKIHALLERGSCPRFIEPGSQFASRAKYIPHTCAPWLARTSAPIACSPVPLDPAPSIVAIGVSTGGPAALEVVLPKLPAEFPLPVVVVQHMPEIFTAMLADRLNSHCKLRVSEAVDGDRIHPGAVYIARGNWHLETVASPVHGGRVFMRLSQGPLENHCRPSVDVLFRSAARAYGAGVLAVVLTGMGCDGLGGCRAVREQRGCVVVQDEASSTVWGMPGAVAAAGLADKVVPLQAVGAEIVHLVAQSTSHSRAVIL